jgi:hypothetical protein
MQSEIPVEWGSVGRQSDTRRAAAGSYDISRSHKRQCAGVGDSAADIATPLRDEILRNLTLDEAADATRERLEVDSLMCRLPYKKMLTSLCNRDSTSTGADIRYVSRAYEESFMHEPMGRDQRECARGKSCECMFIDPSNTFVCVEFLLPGEVPASTPNMCVLCCRATTQQLYYDMMFDQQDLGTIIQLYGNLHSQEGEYALDAMLVASPSAPIQILPLPIVSHQRNRYSVVSKQGIRYLKQHRVLFQDTPSCTADSGK